MRGFFVAIVGLVLASASTAQVPASQSGKSNEKQPATCSVTGQVVTAADFRPPLTATAASKSGRSPQDVTVFSLAIADTLLSTIKLEDCTAVRR